MIDIRLLVVKFLHNSRLEAAEIRYHEKKNYLKNKNKRKRRKIFFVEIEVRGE